MRINRHHITAILATGAAAVAIAAAPTASAAPTLTEQSCAADGAGTECQSPGNVQIYDSPPPVDIDPYGGYGLALGASAMEAASMAAEAASMAAEAAIGSRHSARLAHHFTRPSSTERNDMTASHRLSVDEKAAWMLKSDNRKI